MMTEDFLSLVHGFGIDWYGKAIYYGISFDKRSLRSVTGVYKLRIRLYRALHLSFNLRGLIGF